MALVAGARERRPHRSLAILGAGSAFALGMADLVYGLRGRISKVYLADAVVEGGVIATWLTARK